MNNLGAFGKFIQNTWGISENGKTEAQIKQNRNQTDKNRLFLGNCVVTSGLALPLYYIEKDDKTAQQTIFQDVVINSGILLKYLKPETPYDHLKTAITETTVFSGLVSLVLPHVTNHFKSIYADLGCAFALPLVAEGMSEIVKKVFPNKKEKTEDANKTDTDNETKKTELNEQEEKEKRDKTLIAVGSVALIKAGLLGYNAMQKKGHTSNAIYCASLFNTVKTAVTNEQDFYKKEEKLREVKDCLGIMLDGVVSPLATIVMLRVGKSLNMPDTLTSLVTKATIGGIVASGVLTGVTDVYNSGINQFYNYFLKGNNKSSDASSGT